MKPQEDVKENKNEKKNQFHTNKKNKTTTSKWLINECQICTKIWGWEKWITKDF